MAEQEHPEPRPGYRTWEAIVNTRPVPNATFVPIPEADLVCILTAALPMMEQLRGVWEEQRVDRMVVRAWWDAFEQLEPRDQEPILRLIYDGRRCLIANYNDDVS